MREIARLCQRIAYLDWVENTGARDGIGHQADCRIDAGADVFSGIAGAPLKFREIFLELGRIAIAIEPAHDIHAFHRWTCDLDELLGVERLRSDDWRADTRGAKLSHQGRGGEKVSGDIDHVGIVSLDARDNRAKLAIFERVCVFAKHLDAELIDRALETFECGLTV